MSAGMASISEDTRQTVAGLWLASETFAATGLSPNAANTVPFPSALPSVPRRVSLTPVGNGAPGVLASLDTSQGAADPSNSFAGGKLGFDKNSIYVYIGNATQLLITVEYCR